ncbi:type II toxin-antitoxin system RelE/ParE family toxin [Phyllobacterium sp. YR531]|uniref:type II toxin-antitoxin system RelE/ParE family toxin n=1 Tax=Phyllobacterium sp. YR531 TaxID=1144343 RepID=UPI00026FA9A7|nr:type II toxin-antitoxin system RelE/ParE family toxin [Phyllobacterium sp. YR531]EJN05431.1 phage-related protein [Phyllobacterium sp. YR531]
MDWTVEISIPAEAEMDALPPGLQARLIRLMELVESIGLENMREPHVKHIDGKLWELRAKAAEGIARGMYIAVTGKRIVILHVFVKKSQRTPRGALALAYQRMKQVEV